MSDDGLTMSIDLRVFERDMKELAGPIVDRISLQAIRAGGEVVLEALQDLAPERPDLPSGTALPVGEMARDLQLRASKQPDGTYIARIGPGSRTRHVAVFVEYGHEQSGFAGRGGEKRLIGGRLEGKFVMAHPWIRPAFELSKDEALAVAGFVMESEIAKAAATMGYVA